MLKRILLFCLCLLSFSAFAADSPIGMMQSTSDQLLKELRAEKAEMSKNPGVVYRIVRAVLVPHFDMTSMSRSVLGRDVWSKATPEQKTQFVKEFTTLLIGAYSTAMSSYTDERVEFAPVRGGYQGQPQLQIDSHIIQHNGPPISVTYRMSLHGNVWKVTDFSVEGISMVQSYRSQFASDLSQGNLPGLLTRIEQHNKQTAPKES